MRTIAPSLATLATPAAPRAFARPELWLAGAAFFVSGASGLIYQVAWQRILALHSGVGIYSVAMIVGAFMAGLGVGSHLGGSVSLRMDARGALRSFMLVELGIAVFGALSCPLYYDLLYGRASWLYARAWRAGALHFATLFLPTALMGMSLPVLVRAMVVEVRTAGGTIGFLYGVNVLGASAGALLTPWVLIRFLGIRGAVWVAVAGNLASSLAALGLGVFLRRRRLVAEPPDPRAREPATPDDAARAHPFAFWVCLYALSGFCALSLEILWFRLLDLAVKSKAFTFGTLLCLYLLGSAVGCLGGAPFAGRLRRPLRVFLTCQCALLAYSGLVVLLLAFLPPDAPVYAWFFRHWSKGRGLDLTRQNWRALRKLYLFLPLTLFGVPTVLMGVAFPILQRAVQDDPRTSGRKVGILQAANIAGCVAGSLLVGLLALTWLGTTGTLRLLMACGIAFAAAGIRAHGLRSPFAAFGALLAVLAVSLPGQSRLWTRLHGTENPAALVDEDATGVGAIIPRGRYWVVYVDGKSHSWVPFGGIHTELGAVPALVHPAPADVAIVGLGSGNTAWASGCRPETRSVSVFEILGPQPRLLRQLAQREELPTLRRFLSDPRIQVSVADGRNALDQGERLYDLIEADALWPDVAYAGNLYSKEFFALCARKLKPGGLVCTWAPTARIVTSFSAALPYVLGSPERDVLIGSMEPIALDPSLWKSRLYSPSVAAYLGQESVERVLRRLMRFEVLSRRFLRPGHNETNQDLFPRDEFLTP